MRIGIDGLMLRQRNAGSLRYFEQLLKGIIGLDATGQDEFLVFASRPVLDSIQVSPTPNLRLQASQGRPFLPAALQQQTFLTWKTQGNLDVLHSSVFVPPLLYQGQTVMTIFDLTFRRFPQTQKWTGRLWWRIFARAGLHKADRIITMSESTRNDLETIFKIPPAKVKVIYPWIQEYFSPSTRSSEILNRYGLPEKYLLSVGTLEPRKNFSFLIRAFELAMRKGQLDYALVLVGRRGWMYQDIFATVEKLNLSRKVIFLEQVPDCDLPALYSAAQLFVLLSHYEGFGYPLLEAMACGTPVLGANTSSIPEVLGNAGRLVLIDDVEQTADEIIRLLQDEDLRRQMIELGLNRVKLFSRQQFMTDTLAVYHSLEPRSPQE